MSSSDIDYAVIAKALDPERLVPIWLPDGKRQGREWVARNPNRSDRSAGSFSVNLVTGKWADFAAGSDCCGGDLISLYAYLFHRNDQYAAATELQKDNNIVINAETRRAAAEQPVSKIDDAKPTPIIPVPIDVPAPDFKHFKFGDPAKVWTYRTAEGRTIMHVCRFDPPNMGRKQVVPLTWCNDPKRGERWAWRGITKGKVPLYGLDRLAQNPDAPVLMVEGEKATDEGQELFSPSGWVVVSWLGGVANADNVDLRPLYGRQVVQWPDFDGEREKLTDDEKAAGIDPSTKPLLAIGKQPGVRAMLAIAEALKGRASVQMVSYTPGEFEHGYDLADGWTSDEAMEYLRKNAADPMEVASGRTQKAPRREGMPLNTSLNPFGFPDLSKKSVPLNTVENVRWLMEQYGISAQYNEIKKLVELNLPGRNYFQDTRHENALNELTSICSRNLVPTSQLANYVKNVAAENNYSPVRDWIESKPWDGVERMSALFNTVKTKAENENLKCELMYRWLISAIAAAYRSSDFESHGALVFTGLQGKGKTTWFRRLAPSSMGVILIGASVDPSEKDSVTKAVSHWIVELGELDATFRKADISRLKAFITAPCDKIRRPYDRLESEYKRATVFCGSVNDERYLVDDTGNRRWWTVPALSVDYLHTLDMQQIWAELLTHYKRGVQWWLTKDEEDRLKALNEEHEAIDPVKEKILRTFDFSDVSPLRKLELSASEVLEHIGYDKPSKQQATHASKILKELVGEPRHTKSGRLFALPRKFREQAPF